MLYRTCFLSPSLFFWCSLQFFFLFNYQCDTYVCCVCVYYIFLIKIKKHFMVILFPCNNVVRHTVMSAICLAVRQLNTF